MPLNPQMQQVLDELDSIQPGPVESLPPEAARKGPTPADAVEKLVAKMDMDPAPESVDRVKDMTIDGPEGSIDIRVYAPASDEPLPVLVYWHGGGWVIADLDTYDATPRALANAARCIVVSGHYRQAPENPYPAAVEDAYATYEWVREHAAELGGDQQRIAVAGESAGGNLAAVVSQMAREQGAAPVFQLLVYPVTNHDFDTPSMRESQGAKPLSTEMMRWFWGHYLKNEADGDSPKASPLRASDLSGLPPALVVLAEVDPLRSEGEQYADRLRDAGVDVEIHQYDGVTHEFFGMTAILEPAREAVALAAERLRAAFGADGAMGMATVSEGMEVVTLDQELLGQVKAQRSTDFLLDRSMKRDLYVPLGSVEAVEGGRVRLTVTSAQVEELDWPKSAN